MDQLQQLRQRVLELEASEAGHKHTIEALRMSEEKFSKAFKTSHDSININRLSDGMYLEINDGFTFLTGYSNEDVLGKTSLELNIWDNPQDRSRLVKQLIENKEVKDFEALFRTKDGSVKVALMSANIIEINHEPCILSITRDITERKKTEEALRLSEEKFSKAFRFSPEMIVISSLAEGRLIEVNDAFTLISGYSREEVIGHTPLELDVLACREDYANIKKLLAAGEIIRNMEINLRIKSGEIRQSLFSTERIELDGRECLISVWRDITEKKKMEDDLHKAKEELEASFEEIVATEEELKQKFDELQRSEEALRISEEKFRELFNNANDAIFLYEILEDGTAGKFLEVNDLACKIMGYGREEFFTMSPRAIEDSRFNQAPDKFLAGNHVTAESAHICKDGHIIPVEINSHVFTLSNKRVALAIARDITERKLAEEKLLATHRQLLDIIEFLPDATFVIDSESKIIAWNRAIEEMTGVPKEEMIGKGDYAYTVPFYGSPRPCLIDLVITKNSEIEILYHSVERKGNTLYTEVFVPFLYHGKGAHIWVKSSPLFDNKGALVGAIESIRDISGRKKTEDELKYLVLHDPLTKVYNRAYFEEEMNRLEKGRHLPISIILCDIDGLKLVNDTFGHKAGDNLLIDAANVINDSFRGGDMLARIGGDEFAVLLPYSDEGVVKNACNRIRNSVQRYNKTNPEIPLSMSIGYATKSDASASMDDIFKEADNKMYREKLLRSQSARSAIVQTLTKALEARDYITEGHADRLQDLVANLAVALDMPEHKITDLRLFAQFHDIGKVGIRDQILFKTCSLNREEAIEMRRHSEIGYRIALSSQDLLPIADFILKHHEWWNGEGYPLGLRKEEIPLECRILAIADAYDAMTSDRPYRKAMSMDSAIHELKRCAGTQFDPVLVYQFVAQLTKIMKNT
jgi:diguanylate cyclase (GGDEF)-like protein/PAS domain S-box-containing protein